MGRDLAFAQAVPGKREIRDAGDLCPSVIARRGLAVLTMFKRAHEERE